MIRVIINGKEFDTFAGTDIAQTKQTNDISNIATNQTNYTNSFDLPMTPKNVENLKFLSVVGNRSDIPYKKNECYLFDRLTGECFVYKGWAVIQESTSVYKCYVYDGNLDLYKTIENFLLKDLDLSELAHVKDVATVKASFSNQTYRYILADYGGKVMYDPAYPKINIDYLTPSVNVKFLWDKLFEHFGITYSGSVFETSDFLNWWMTYPKGLTAADMDSLVMEADDYTYLRQPIRYGGFPLQLVEAAYFAKATQWEEGPEYAGVIDGIHMVVSQSGTYRMDISGTIETATESNYAWLLVGKNASGLFPSMVFPVAGTHNVPMVEVGEPFTRTFIFELNAQDSICVVLRRGPDTNFVINEDTTSLSVEFNKVNPAEIDFSDALIDFSATDFVKEVMANFGLSLFKDKYLNHYEFLTMDERLETAEVVDWSDKYVKTISENYIYGSYAQQNILNHKYNEEDVNYNDGVLDIENVNLPPQKPLFQSKVYTPEREVVDFLSRPTHIYRSFDRKLKEDGTMEYKALDKRFYFLRSLPYSFPIGTEIGSEQLGTSEEVGMVAMESYRNLAYSDVIQQNYLPIRRVLNRSLVVKALMNLSTMDVANIDFRKKYYISQKNINGYFMLNKINSYRSGKLTVVEWVRITPDFPTFTQSI